MNKIEYYQMEHDRLMDEIFRLKSRLGEISPRTSRELNIVQTPSSAISPNFEAAKHSVNDVCKIPNHRFKTCLYLSIATKFFF